MATPESRIITVGVTGASGAVYAQAVLRLLDADRRVERVFFVASDAGLRLLSTELGVVAADGKKLPSLLTGTAAKKFEYLPNKDIGASIASGSAAVDAMVVVPCSAGALGSIAAGTADDLLDARRGRLPEGAPPARPVPARDAAQSHSSRKHAARARRGRHGDARDARVLLRAENDRRHGRAIRLSRARADWLAAGEAVSLEGKRSR